MFLRLGFQWDPELEWTIFVKFWDVFLKNMITYAMQIMLILQLTVKYRRSKVKETKNQGICLKLNKSPRDISIAGTKLTYN